LIGAGERIVQRLRRRLRGRQDEGGEQEQCEAWRFPPPHPIDVIPTAAGIKGAPHQLT
jgi:hypothetical protein